MLSHIYFSLSFGLYFLFIPNFLRTDLYITALFIIKFAKPYIFSLLYFFHIFAELYDLFVVLIGAIVDDVLNVVLNNKGVSL